MDRRTFRFLLKSHRLFGLFLIAFILLLSTTGIALNHTDALGLAKLKAPGFIAARYYADISDIEVMGFKVEQQHFYALGGQLYANGLSVTDCNFLQGAVAMHEQWVALCDSELLFITPQLEFIEQVGLTYGLPEQVLDPAWDKSTLHESMLAAVLEKDRPGLLILKTSRGNISLDPLQLMANDYTGSVSYISAVPVPDKYLLAETISWQQFILDLHSGVFAGKVGKWWMDMVAILLILMAFSGFFMWRRFH